jgi:NAD(P)-dependent dehydrogenase (short-subunit alcohol dehydrogenase family)
MVAAGVPGSIVNIASVLGLEVRKGVAAYAVSKAGVIQLTRVLALELARHRIRVNALAPGYVETEMNTEFLQSETGQKMIAQMPQRRTGSARELAGALLLAASGAGGYMTGSTILIDGGQSLVMP